MFQTYEEAVGWITKLMKQQGIKPGLARIEALMERLGNPHRRLKFIHVAGTNGKGSTCAFLDSVIRSAGYDVGVFTSPYLEKYTNRIQYNGRDIPEETLVSLANQVKPLADELEGEHGALSMFEISVAIAILYFAKVCFPDYVVWETGMGGTLDSTNIVYPIASVITNVGLDHTDALGEKIADIAGHKAGIIKAGVPVITAAEGEALETIRDAAKAKKCSMYTLGEHFRYETREVREGSQSFDFHGPFRSMTGVNITMDGAHQQTNAATALMTIEVLRQFYALVVEEEQLYEGMRQAAWKGRLEIVSERPRILLDGAHNADGAKALAAALNDVYKYRKLHFVLGMVRNKNHREYLRHILPIVDTVIVTEPDFFKKANAADLALAVDEWKREHEGSFENILEPNWKDALERAKALAAPDDLIVVSGSLYFLSDARSWILNETDSEKGW
ncbi:bifunctional folylpolyglutamate synthase/dihydrofolate synthase [Paenibacillus thermotolerans]|uniref:bifunctional folylpolyglutamate synthase/dihydrofolate synthase n=1 Tax=Paenibacillus thermotolerans TaxID=3027807 RepID=UPI002367A833|nr:MULTISPECIES: folylpolyglutamate synthase/dihydrofolate synthase family protein [unclassified Paenibacillus]